MDDLRQTKQYASYMKSCGWQVETLNGGLAYIKRFPFIGNFIKFQRPDFLTEKTIKTIIKKYKPFQFVIEPKKQSQSLNLSQLGFKQSKTYYAPSKTIRINLKKSLGELLNNMHHKTRYNIGKSVKNRLFITHHSKDINLFADFWQKCALKQRGMFLSQTEHIKMLYKSFGKDASIILIEKTGVVLSGILMICTSDTAYYMYAASSDEGKKKFAPTFNAWEAIKTAKKLKKEYFDFEGIFDDRFPIKSWIGFSRFKKSFGGNEIEYPGTFTKFRFPI